MCLHCRGCALPLGSCLGLQGLGGLLSLVRVHLQDAEGAVATAHGAAVHTAVWVGRGRRWLCLGLLRCWVADDGLISLAVFREEAHLAF